MATVNRYYGGAYYGNYDAGSENVSTTELEVVLEEDVQQLLLYPTSNCFVKLNGSDKEIFIPKGGWTPISIMCTSFKVRAEENGELHWQGWIV